MAAGTPVVGYDRGGLGEYVRDAGAGAAVTGLDAFVAAVDNLVADPARWQRVSAAARTAAETRHSVTSHVTALEAVYELAAIGSR
jgi:glycosyltransferase involved in cell wall biosynthesis